MTKFTGVPINSSPSLNDYLVGVTVGGVDDRITLQQLLTLFLANMGAMPNWPAGLAYSSATQSLTGGAAATAMAADTKVYDQNNNYNASTKVFTAPTAGVYRFDIFILGNNGVSSRLIPSFSVNGTTYGGGQMTDTFSTGIGFLEIKLNAGDTVTPQLAANPSTVATSFGVNNARFSFHRIA